MTVVGPITLDLFRSTIGWAIRAPSVYNAQPWRFALGDDGIAVRIDPYRQLPIADPGQWASRIACGAAIANIELSLAIAGIATRTTLWPDSDDPLLVATIGPSGRHTASPRERTLHAAIDRRHSNRRPFFDTPVPDNICARLEAAVDGGWVWIALVRDRGPVARIAEIIRSADQQLRRDSAYVAEMNAWIARAENEAAGIPHAAAGPQPASQDLLAMRDFGGSKRVAGRDFETDPLLAVVGTRGDSRYDDVTAGSAIQRVLLTATDARLATSLLSQPIEIPSARNDLRDAVHRLGTPQIVIRLGFGQNIGVSARRPVGSVIDLPG